MEWQFVMLIIVGGLIFFLMSGLPVFAAFLLIDIVGILFFMGGPSGLTSLIRSMLASIGKFTLTPVPLFIIMGEVIFVSGLASKAIEVVERVLSRLPGRLSMVAVGAGVPQADSASRPGKKSRRSQNGRLGCMPISLLRSMRLSFRPCLWPVAQMNR